MSRPSRYTAIQMERMKDMRYKQKRSLRDIGMFFGCSNWMVAWYTDPEFKKRQLDARKHRPTSKTSRKV